MKRLGQGWSPTQRQRLGVRIVVAVLLLANPFYIGVLNLDMTGTTYSVKELTIEDGRIEMLDDVISSGAIPGIDCSGYLLSAGCAYERSRVRAGELQFTSEFGPIDPKVPIAYHIVDGEPTYYERTINYTSPSGETLVLDPIAPEAALDRLAVPESSLSLRTRVALWRGETTTETPFAGAEQVIETDGGYVVFVPTRERYLSSGETVETLISVVLFIGGAVLLWQTYNQLPRE